MLTLGRRLRRCFLQNRWQGRRPSRVARALGSFRYLLTRPASILRFVSIGTIRRGILFHGGFACGGIAVGDVDCNGLPDLFFVDGPGRNRLYLQRSPWRFIESADERGIADDDGQPLGGDGWGTGASLLDIDNDGDLDLYICNYDAPNRLYINDGEGTFVERASDYGLDIVDASLMPSFADFDRDGDLDIYLAANRYLVEREFSRRDLFFWQDGLEYLRPAAEKYFAIRRHFDRVEQLNMWAGRSDRLLRNEGPGRKFTGCFGTDGARPRRHSVGDLVGLRSRSLARSLRLPRPGRT